MMAGGVGFFVGSLTDFERGFCGFWERGRERVGRWEEEAAGEAAGDWPVDGDGDGERSGECLKKLRQLLEVVRGGCPRREWRSIVLIVFKDKPV
jgi:hypothetical protein